MQENEFRMEEFQLISVCSGSLRRINTLRPKEKKIIIKEETQKTDIINDWRTHERTRLSREKEDTEVIK